MVYTPLWGTPDATLPQLNLEVGHEIFYWDPQMVCGSEQARRYATVMKITDDPDYPLRLSCFMPLGPTDEVHVVHPYKMNGFRKLKDFVLVPGIYRGEKKSESKINAALFKSTVHKLMPTGGRIV